MTEKYSTNRLGRYDNFRTYKRREVAPVQRRASHLTHTPKHVVSDFVTKAKTHHSHSFKKKVVHTYKPIKVSHATIEVVRPPIEQHKTQRKPTGKPLYVSTSQKRGSMNIWRVIFTPRYMLPAMAVSLFLVGLGVSLQGFYQNHRAAEATNQQAQVEGATTAEEDAPPDETEPTPQGYSAYQVAPDLPRYMRIDKIGLSARIQRIGMNAKGELKAPANIYNVGWYENSAKPGDVGGASLFDAHVHGPTKPGAFYKLKNVSNGDVIEVERGDGQVISFKVVSKESVPTAQVDMAKALVSADTSKAGLTLITCDGKYNYQTDDYENRLVVYAVRI